MKQSNNRWLRLTLVLFVVGITSSGAQVDEISGDYEDLSDSISDSKTSSGWLLCICVDIHSRFLM